MGGGGCCATSKRMIGIREGKCRLKGQFLLHMYTVQHHILLTDFIINGTCTRKHTLYSACCFLIS
jgi:hypothetical protein